jgi:N-6 DNA Methylase
MIHFDEIISKYGGDPSSFLRLDGEDRPELLPYATLTAARASGSSELDAVIGIYLWQDRPFIVLVDGDLMGKDANRLNSLRRLIAMRGDAPYLAVVTPGTMSVYSVGLQGSAKQYGVNIEQNTADIHMFIPYLASERPLVPANREWISDVILRLLTGALDKLVSGLNIADGDAISLVGRALFVRFLADRGLVPHNVVSFAAGGIHELFDTPACTMKISRWLDTTFNGDFLPLSEKVIAELPAEAFTEVGHILRRAPEGQFHLDWQENWAQLNFAHIPVGVLSQAYERYLSAHEKEKQKKEGSFYTPRHIADLMVQASFAALRRSGFAHTAKVLDPAAGAGVFLITAFRQLVAENWIHDKVRPNTEKLRTILNDQITGFDINDSALRFAALGLYLMSIELDPNPEPVQKLKFRNFRPGVLQKLGAGDGISASKDLGSLGSDVGSEHFGRYDLVIGNPPWAKATKLTNWKSVEKDVLRIARHRLRDDNALAPIPNAVTDLPFVWRAMEWARRDGQISFALHARLLFQRGDGMVDARRALFGSLNITGIINGAEVRNTKVWPEVAAPFCLIFASNAPPAPGALFRFVCPQLEGPLNESGGWRIDVENAPYVSLADVRRRPELLKILFRGTKLDLEVYDRIATKGFNTIGDFWRKQFGEEEGRPKFSGNGYQSLKPSSRMRKGSEFKGASAKYLSGLPELPSKQAVGLVVDANSLDKFSAEYIHDPRDLSIFQGPLLLVRKSPPTSWGRIKVSTCSQSLIYNESYYGYSAKVHESPSELVHYLALIIGSKIALWHSLITSGEFGFEREKIEKYVIDEIIAPPFHELSQTQRETARHLFADLAHEESSENWDRVDNWVATLFDLAEDDIKTISDTLQYRLPFGYSRNAAQIPPSIAEQEMFTSRLEAELKPWAERNKKELAFWLLPMPLLSPWRFVCIGKSADSVKRILIDNWSAAIDLSDKLASTEIIIVDDEASCLILGRLNQARYWSSSQARLVARRLIWENIDFLSGKKFQK